MLKVGKGEAGSVKMRLPFPVSDNFQLPEFMSEKVKNGAAKIRCLNLSRHHQRDLRLVFLLAEV